MTCLDKNGRALTSLRVSVTDRCNLRCSYCMPEEEQNWLPKNSLASFEELETLVRVTSRLGVRKVRLTGGEPLLRRGLPTLVAALARIETLEDLALTTNGLRLADEADSLREASLGRITVSMDTLRPDRYLHATRRDSHARMLAGLEAATRAGFKPIKLNAVVVRGTNDDELVDLLRFARDHGHILRFIEYMDVGGALDWTLDQVVRRDQMLERIQDELGPVQALEARGTAPAELFELEDGTRFGIVASVSTPFCGTCDRARLTSDGRLFTCLYAREGLDLLAPLRAGANEDELTQLLQDCWSMRTDRGAEDRLALGERGPSVGAAELRQDPHLGMHTKGG